MIDVFTRERICPDCPFKSKQRPAKVLNFDSAVCSLIPRCNAHCGNWLCRGWDAHGGVFFSLNLEPLTPLCDAHCGDWQSDAHRGDCLRGVMLTAEIFMFKFMFMTPEKFEQLYDANRGVWLTCSCVMHTTEIDSAVRCSPRSFLKNSNISAKSKKNSKILY